MKTVTAHNLFIFMTITVTGVSSSLGCSDTNLTISGGNFTLSDMYNDGSILRYHCPEGYYPHPVKIRYCYGGQWDPAPKKKQPVCKLVTCPDPKVMNNGVVDPCKRIYYVNDTTTYRCHSDYTFRGSSTRVCQANGKWSGGTPICTENFDHCSDPGIPPGASRIGHIFNIGEYVKFRCHNNLELLGSERRVCQDNGQWSGKEPECYAAFTYDTPEEVAEAFSSSLNKTFMRLEEQAHVSDGKRIKLGGGKLDIYIAMDTSDMDGNELNETKNIIKQLVEKVHYSQISPNFEIIIFAADVITIVTVTDYKRRADKQLKTVIQELEDFKFDVKENKAGTNIAKAYGTILDSISFEKARERQDFNDIHHVIIMFTDGNYNMGGNPKRNVEEIKELVYNGQPEERDEFLDMYVFSAGDDVPKDHINQWVTNTRNEKRLFLLQDMEKVQKSFDQMHVYHPPSR